MLGDPQHIRDDLVRVATAIPNAAVRSRLMYSLAAHLMKANHSFEGHRHVNELGVGEQLNADHVDFP